MNIGKGSRKCGAEAFFAYRIQHLIGSGGFSKVYLAVDGKGEKVALKIPADVNPNSQDTIMYDRSIVKQFEREAEIWEKLTNGGVEGIVRLREYGTEPFPWFAMDYMPGGSLRSSIEKGRFEPEVLEKVLDILSDIHHYGVVHGDIKPENILFNDRGEPFLTDFGLGKEMGRASRSAKDSFSGTLQYSAPEQFVKSKGIDWRTDIYQCGVLAYEMMSGTPPFQGDLAELTYNIMNTDPKPLEGEDWEVNKVIKQAMSKEKNDRYKNTEAFKQAFFTALEGNGKEKGSRSKRRAKRIRARERKAQPHIAWRQEDDREKDEEIACPECGTMISGDAIMCYACGGTFGEEADVSNETSDEKGDERPCPECATMISKDASVCYACGKDFAGKPSATGDDDNPYPLPDNSGELKGLKKSPWIAVVAMIVVTVILATILYFMIGGFTSSSDTDVSRYGSITVEEYDDFYGAIDFGRFYPTTYARDLSIVISNSSAWSSEYYYEYLSFYTYYDDANTGESLEYFDLSGDGAVGYGDQVLFRFSNGCTYEINIYYQGDWITSEEATLYSDYVPQSQTGSISLYELSNYEIEIDFGDFSPAPLASAITIQIYNNSYYLSTYYFNSYYSEYSTDLDNANTGSYLSFYDYFGDGYIDGYDSVDFSSAPGNYYEVTIMVDGDTVAYDSIST